MELSSRIKSVNPSVTLAVTGKAKQMKADGIDVVSFGAGEPDFPTPPFICAAAKSAIDAGDTKYTPKCGADLKAAIVEKLQRENNLNLAPANIIPTFGGKQALFNAFQVLLDPGDKVLIPAPYWVSYPEQVKLAGGQSVFIPTGPEKGFKITGEDIIAHAEDAKILIINSPCNPTGVTYTPEELKDIADAVLQTDLIVFTDEIYEKLIYGDTRFVSFASLDDRLAERTLTFNGLAKTFSMTGWRIGWVAGPADVVKALATLASHQTNSPAGFIQAGALAAYTDPAAAEAIETMRQEFEKRGRHMHQRLNAIDGVSCAEPTGAFYCFPDVSACYAAMKVAGSLDFAGLCLNQAKIALVPGIAFGEDRCVRLSFATSLEQIDKGIDRLEEMIRQA